MNMNQSQNQVISIYRQSYPESPCSKDTALRSCDLLTSRDLHQVNKVRIIKLRMDHELCDANGRYVTVVPCVIHIHVVIKGLTHLLHITQRRPSRF